MVIATFRFYGELNSFIAPERRQRGFACACARAATAKHMIEALGVPHTEVELVLVNGESCGLERLLRDGDRVAVFPRFEMLDIAPLRRLRTGPPDQMRFVADAHLGGLAHLLRMAGFDTLYDNGFHDDRIAALAAAEARIVLTRDRELLKRRSIARGRYVRALKSTLQLREIFDRFDLARAARPFTLCLHCNAPLRAVGKAEVEHRLPPAVRLHYERFSTCDLCDRVFWEGTHWRSMRLLLDDVCRHRQERGCSPGRFLADS